MVPGETDAWARLDICKQEEVHTSPCFAGGHLCLDTAPHNAVLRDTGIPGADRVWMEFKVSREEGVEGWQVGILPDYRHPRNLKALFLDQESVKVMQIEGENESYPGEWTTVSRVAHALRPTPSTWHRLVVSVDPKSGTATVYLDEQKAACVQVGKKGLGERFGIVVNNATVSVRKVKVGKQCEPR